MATVRELGKKDLYRHSDLTQLDFHTTADLDDLAEVIGQPRAVEAMRFGIGIQQDGYNIFAMGAAGTGKQSLVLDYFMQGAATKPSPPDWCYVYNFAQPHQPNAISLPPGTGTAFQKDMTELLEDVRTALATAFESDDYRSHRQEIEEGTSDWQQQALTELNNEAQQKGLALVRTQQGFAFAPFQNGQLVPPEEYEKLPPEQRDQLEKDIEDLQDKLERLFLQQSRMMRELREKVQQYDRSVADTAIKGHLGELRKKYKSYSEIVDYLSAVREDILNNIKVFLPHDDTAAQEANAPAWPDPSAQVPLERLFLQRYQVNLLINNGDRQGPPVIYEDHPTYQNLIGRVEYRAQMGALTTDFTLIKPGALHRANGGYLVLDARKVFEQPYAWEGLKRALRSGSIRIEIPQQMDGMMSTISLDPEPIPLNVKVALLGERELYYMLNLNEPEFGELFKVVADFDDVLERTPENEQRYARLIATLARRAEMRPFDRQAVARVIEHGSRLAQDSEKLTAHVRSIADLMHESDYLATEAGREVVLAEDIQRAIDAQIYRTDRVRERMLETTLRGMILIDTEGKKIGQVNGLSVLQLGGYAFGHPSRITAQVRLGSGEVIDIEREVDLSGPIHSKGVLILSGFLGARYATNYPLSLSASLVFEQLYSGVEGDSASSAELYALLSTIAGIPIKQSLAVTGSVNQHGEIQPIGGVNEKIEGFFDVCQSRGLTGDQGVLIPHSNAQNLMLRQDVIEAVEAGSFHIYPVETIDQGIELLTGVSAGKLNKNGEYPATSVNGRVAKRLLEMAKQRAQYRAMTD